MKYYSQFKDLDNNTIKVEVDTINSGEDTELLIAADGLTITYNGENLYKPLIKSGCSIDFVIDNVIPDFYTGQPLNPKVYVYKNNTLFWYGYVTPNVYNQPYNLHYETLTLECIDTLAQANNINYTYIGDNVNQQSFIDIIKHILDSIDPLYVMKSIFVTDALSIDNNTNIMEQINIVERNFSDELDNVMKGDEVLEEICKYLGLSMFQYKDAYYIVDYNKLDAGFIKYDRSTGTTTNGLNLNELIINDDVKVVDTAADISIEGLYNKVTIQASTLKMDQPVDTIFDELEDNSNTSSQYWDNDNNYESFEIYANPEIDYTQYHSNIITNNVKTGIYNMWKITSEPQWANEDDDYSEWKTYKILSTWLKPNENNNWTVTPPIINGTSYIGQMSYDKSMKTSNGIMAWTNGVSWQKSTWYEIGKEPMELKWNNYLTISSLGGFAIQNQEALEQHVVKYEAPSLTYKGGAFIVNFEYFLSVDNLYASMGIPELNYVFDRNTGPDPLGHFGQMLFPATLSIGNHYWTGDEWREYNEDFLKKIEEGYFAHDLYSKSTSNQYVYVYASSDPSQGGYVIQSEFRYIWATWNETINDWDYVTETAYNNFTGTKVRYEMPYLTQTWNGITLHYIDYEQIPAVYWILDENDNKIQVTGGSDKPIELQRIRSDWRGYQHQYISDKFWLAKKFDDGDKVYGTTYKLNNTTDYRLNLNEGAEGIALVVPENLTLVGKFTFSLGRPIGWTDSTSDVYNPLKPNGIAKNTLRLVTHISDLYIKYSQSGGNTDNNNDIIYYNIINSGYINELDDVEMKVNTYTNKTTSYSYVLHNNEYLENITYDNVTQMQEKHIIDKLVNHYSTKKYVYNNVIHNNDVTLCTLLKDSTLLNTKMPVTAIAYDMTKNYVSVTCIEI